MTSASASSGIKIPAVFYNEVRSADVPEPTREAVLLGASCPRARRANLASHRALLAVHVDRGDRGERRRSSDVYDGGSWWSGSSEETTRRFAFPLSHAHTRTRASVHHTSRTSLRQPGGTNRQRTRTQRNTHTPAEPPPSPRRHPSTQPTRTPWSRPRQSPPVGRRRAREHRRGRSRLYEPRDLAANSSLEHGARRAPPPLLVHTRTTPSSRALYTHRGRYESSSVSVTKPIVS